MTNSTNDAPSRIRGVRYLRTRGAGGAGALVDTVWLVSAVVLSMGGC
jgi:hypothetical protein